ncbi:MAG: DUF3169 family protein [Lachnospiraceae bacterium]|nr:DUF3169 family protein [Lachnospiraceae bacterium]
MFDRKAEIKKENKKAFKWFMLIIVISGFVGGLIGGLGYWSGESVIGLKEKLALTAANYAPYLMAVTGFLFHLYSWSGYMSGKKLFQQWTGADEEEDVPKQIELKISYGMTASALNTILNFLLFAFGLNDQVMKSTSSSRILISLGLFVINLALIILYQQKAVDLLKEMNPEKQGSIYDVHFQKKWMVTCDEGEKAQIYESAWTAYYVMNNVFVFAWLITFLANNFFQTGLFACIVVTILWAIQSFVYCYKSIQLSK